VRVLTQIGVSMPLLFPQYLSVKEVSKILGVSDKFVFLHQKEIAGYVKIAGKILFDAEILYKELKKTTVKVFPD
jgi:hypothetical protein